MSADTTMEELAAEFLERRQSGEALEMETFISDHPEYAEDLRKILPLMLDMEQLKPASFQTPASSPAKPERTNLPDSDYRLVRKIGSGGMGVVFESIQVSLNRKVAVKLLNSSLLTSAEQRTQFENEAKVIAMLHHPNIVKIYSAGCSEERCFYAMELIEGTGLEKHKFEDLHELARIALQAADALAYAHRCGILHRDIKPANMLLDKEGNLHISDFGIAFILTGEEPVVEQNGIRSGTVRYMAPERLANGVNTFATDQYSFGVALYELITGQPVLTADSQEDLKERICSSPIPPLVCREPELAAIINKCISFDPENRYHDMEETAAELRRFLNREPVKAAGVNPWRRFTLWCRRKPAVAALTFAFGFFAAAFAVSLVIGYIQTRAALRLAERNAMTADAVISRIFARVSEQPPSPQNTRLLTALLPYYQSIARQHSLSPEKISEAYKVIGECALRAGSYPMAEDAFRKMMLYRNAAWPVNQLAAVLRKSGRKAEADRLSRRVIARFGKSKDPKDRYEAVRALLAVSADSDSKESEQAFRLLESLLKDHPDNPEYRFQYAVLLGRNPRLYRSLRIPGLEPNAAKLLSRLAEAYPEQPEYSLALIELMHRRFRFARSFQNSRDAIGDALHVSERMLGRWPNDPQIVSAVVKLHSRYVEILRKRGAKPLVFQARMESERLMAILEILFYNPEITDSVKEELIRFQLQRLDLLKRRGGSPEIDSLTKKINRELNYYKGPKRDEFRKQLDRSNQP